ncbi:MAG: hypothetical protein ACOX0T_07530 [Pelotomaculum sp.]
MMSRLPGALLRRWRGTLRKYIDEYIFGINDDTLPGVVGQKISPSGL